MDIDYQIYDDMSAVLKAENLPAYFNGERWLGQNPMQSLTVLPGTGAFFGSKVLNLFIVGIPYGWVFQDGVWQENWPPDGYEDLINLHKSVYSEFTEYKTYVWTDFNIVETIMAVNPESRFAEMMAQTETRMMMMCAELSDYGFMFVGRNPTQGDLQALADIHYIPPNPV